MDSSVAIDQLNHSGKSSAKIDDRKNSPSCSAQVAGEIRVFPFCQIPADLLARWDSLRFDDSRGEACQVQPFFSPRFAAAVDQARGDVHVAIAVEPGHEYDEYPNPRHAVAFLPFHRVGKLGVPVGRFLNDAHNVVGLSSEQIDWTSWLQACEVVAFDFHAIAAPADCWQDKHRLQSVKAFRADFGDDSVAFLRQLERDHRTIFKQGQKTRKLAREVGEVRLEIDCRCPEILQRTIDWKRSQYQRTHILDLFLPEWTRRLVEELHHGEGYSVEAVTEETIRDFQEVPLRGLLSVLWAGDRVIAAHYGMIERGRLHYWFPAYDPAYSRYSPGTALFTEIVRVATTHGIDCLDMGYGEQPYKQKQTATTSELAFGTITNSKWHQLTYSLENQLVSYLKKMPMKEVAKRGWRAIRPAAGIKKLS